MHYWMWRTFLHIDRIKKKLATCCSAKFNYSELSCVNVYKLILNILIKFQATLIKIQVKLLHYYGCGVHSYTLKA
jgi:hypothetical protein